MTERVRKFKTSYGLLRRYCDELAGMTQQYELAKAHILDWTSEHVESVAQYLANAAQQIDFLSSICEVLKLGVSAEELAVMQGYEACYARVGIFSNPN